MEFLTSAGYLNGWLRHDRRWTLFRERWPQWIIQFAEMDVLEEFDWAGHIIWLDCRAPHVNCRLGHAAGHLACGHWRGYSSRFTWYEEDEADECASFWESWGFETPLPALAEEAGT